jgi:glycosyltransferase involved in cell wall biosynthesis
MSASAEQERLLFLAPIAPSDHGNGLAMRCGFLLDAYARSFAVDLALIPVASRSDRLNDFIAARVRRAQMFRPSGPDSHFALLERLADPAARLEAFERYGRPSLTSTLTGELRGAIEAWCGTQPYRIVHVSRLYLAGLAAPWVEARARARRLVLDCDEDDAAAYRRIARMQDRGGHSLAAAWSRAEAAGYERLAPHWLPQFDLVLAASPSEARSLYGRAGGRPVIFIPNTVAAAPPRRRSNRRRRVRTIIFVGTMGYAPNADGIAWFATRVWPRLRREVPFPVRLMIVGADPPATVARFDARCDMMVTGEVGDVGPFYDAADLVIVPLRAGGGTRIKLLEAAARGVPVVSTRFGAMGTSLQDGRDLLIADDAASFARACAAMLSHEPMALAMAARARGLIRLDYAARAWAARLAGLACGPGSMTE